MGYQVSRSGKQTWRLIFQKGQKEKRNIAKDSREAKELGFSTEFTYEEAKARADQLRDEKWVLEHAEKESKSKALFHRYQKLRSAFLTDKDADEFERIYIPEKRIAKPHWHTMQSIIVAVGIHPSYWYQQSSVIFQEFTKRKYSPNYCKKLLRYLNMWGYFLCVKQNKAWKDVENTSVFWKRKIADAYEKRIQRTSMESEPISPELLEEKRLKLSRENYNWIFISIQFGLRPREVDNLLSANVGLWKIEVSPEFGYVLHVFQQKLYERGIPREKCWKFVPTVLQGQIKAIGIIKSKNFKRPIGKQGKLFRDVFGRGFTAYGGRKNFVDMLRDQGYDLETVSRWAGHRSVRTTERDYSKSTKVFYRPPIKKAS